MATALKTFRFTARSCSCQSIAQRYTTRSIGRRRAFSSTPFRRQEEEDDDTNLSQIEQKANRHHRANYRKRLEAEIASMPSMLEEAAETMDEAIIRQSQAPEEFVDRRKSKPKPTFANMGEPDMEDYEEEDYGEDISSIAHGELEAHREKRHYARLAAWDMPLLSKMAKPFEPPTADMPLRFRYTTYMGEQHPAEKKVVLEFCIADMPDLTKIQREKLQKLAGARYNPEKDIVKMSCEMFESQAQNKRYLGDRVDELLKEARDPIDAFADVPLDVRHHTFKTKLKFPIAWKMTAKRKEELAQHRAEISAKDQQLLRAGQLVDGVKQIKDAWARAPAENINLLPEMVSVGKGKAQKGKRKMVATRRG